MSEEEIINYLENQNNSLKWDYGTLQAIKGLADHKNNAVEDLQKAIFYIQYEIDQREVRRDANEDTIHI